MTSRLQLLQHFVTKYRHVLLGASAVGVLALKLAPHIAPQWYYPTVYQLWDQDGPVQLPRHHGNLFQEVAGKFGLNDADGRFKVFPLYGFYDPFSAGLSWLPGGAILGVPSYFLNATSEDVQNKQITVSGKLLDFASDEGKRFCNSLVFSDSALKFAIGRELALVKSNAALYQATLPPVCLAGTYAGILYTKQLLGLFQIPFHFRVVLNLLGGSIGLAVYHLLSDTMEHYFDHKADKMCAKLGREYAQGGIEFYDKLLVRNQALRVLLGREGQKLYTPYGNVQPKSMFHMKHPQLTERRRKVAEIYYFDFA
ncbi:transmembrane protein 177-like [Branchiostoma floridae x Branchiostoma belcheri]